MNIETFNKNFAEYEQSYKPKYEFVPLYVLTTSKKYWLYTICIYDKYDNDELEEWEKSVKITVEKEWYIVPIDKAYIPKNPDRIKTKISYFIKKHNLW